MFTRVGSARAFLDQNQDLWSADSGLSEAIHGFQQDAAATAATSQQAVVELEHAIATRREVLDELRRSLANVTAEGDAARHRYASALRRQQELLAVWVSTGMSGTPSSAELNKESDRTEKAEGRLEHINSRRGRLVESFRRWLNDEALARAEMLLKDQMSAVGSLSEADTRSRLQKLLFDAERKYDSTERTREKVDSIVSVLQGDADQFADQVLQPLNSTIRRFSRALMTRADASIVYRAEHFANRSELRPGITHLDATGEEMLLEINPLIFMLFGCGNDPFYIFGIKKIDPLTDNGNVHQFLFVPYPVRSLCHPIFIGHTG
jgi:exonuclease SbcC